MASKVEILGGTLDGSILDNAASESTLRELVDAIRRLEATSARGTRGGGGGGGRGGGSTNVDINTDPANSSLNDLSSTANKSGKLLSSALGGLARGLSSAATGLTNSLTNMAGQVINGQNNLSGFVGALGALPGPLGKFASLVSSSIATLEGYQKTQRELTMAGASFNNSMMEMRIAAAQAGMSLDDYAGFLKHHTQDIAGLGDTITDGAKKLSQVGEAVGKTGLDVEFMKLGYSAVGARQAAMRFSTELVKGDKVRGSSARELAEASLSYEKDLDLLAKQTGKSKDQLREFSDSLVKRGGALQFALARLSPEVQASMKGIMNTVGATMGQGAQDVLVDMLSGAAAPSSEMGAMFQAQVPGVVEAFKEMREVANDTSLSDAERKAKTDKLMAQAQAEQLQFLQTEQGRFMMENKQRLSPAQREFITGLEQNASALAKQGIDINNATQADIERVTAAKRAEQERQAELDKGFNAFQATITRISSAIQTTFFTILSPILERLAGGLNAMMDTFGGIENKLADMGIAIETITPVVNYIVDLLGITLGTAFETVSFLAMKVWDGFTSLLQPIKELFAAFGFLGTDTNGVIDAFGSLIGGITSVVTIIKDVLGGAFDFLFTLIRLFIGAITDIVNVFKTTFEPQIRFVSEKLKQFGDFMLNIGTEILNGIRTIFSSEGAMMIASGVKTMMQTATGKLLSGISDIIPDWAGGKKLAEISKDMLNNADASKKATVAHYDAARTQATQRDQVVQQEIENRKGQVAQSTANFKQNLETGKRELAARREREKAEAESAELRKQIEKDKQVADAMERSRQAAIKRMQELAGITPGAPGAPVKPGEPAKPGVPIPVSEMQKGMLSSLKEAGITDPKAQANILAQIQAESGFKPRSEELGKYTAQNLFSMYGSGQTKNKVRFKTLEEAQAVVSKGPEAVGNVIYGGRMGNKEDEGFKYRGRGMIQLTGKDNYAKYGKLLGIDLVGNPDLANDPTIAQKIATAYFVEKQKSGVNLADINAIGKAVGYAGGAGETTKRAGLAQQFAANIESGKLTASTPGTGGTTPSVRVAQDQSEAESERLKRLAQQAAQSQSANAAPKPISAGSSVPPAAAVAAAAAEKAAAEKAAAEKAAADKAAADKAAAEKAADPKLKPENVGTSQVDLASILSSLNTNISSLVQLQARNVQLADQQLSAVKGLSRDAYTAI